MRTWLSWPVAAVIALAAGQALAVDWSADTTRILGDPAFLPLAGQVSGSFEYTYAGNTYDFQNDRVNSWDKSSNAFLPALQYGLTDNVTLFGQFGWENLRAQDDFVYQRLVFTRNPFGVGPLFRLVPTHQRDTYFSLGADNPVFGATWRAIDQRFAPVSVDLTASYEPDLFQARDAGSGNTGTVASGGQRGTIEAAVSREMAFLTVRGSATFGYNGRRDVLQDGGFFLDRLGAHPDYAAGVQTEARILPWLALNAGVNAQKSVQFGEQFSAIYGSYGETAKPGGSVSPYADLVVPLLDHRLVAELGYQHDFIGDEKIEEQGVTVGRYFDQESNLFFTRVLFVFGTR
jgi:hypothetical protein